MCWNLHIHTHPHWYTCTHVQTVHMHTQMHTCTHSQTCALLHTHKPEDIWQVTGCCSPLVVLLLYQCNIHMLWILSNCFLCKTRGGALAIFMYYWMNSCTIGQYSCVVTYTRMYSCFVGMLNRQEINNSKRWEVDSLSLDESKLSIIG